MLRRNSKDPGRL